VTGESKLALLREAARELQLSVEEQRDFANYFIGALSERVPEKDWANAIETARVCTLDARKRGIR
jgi:hypothetical protein